jgi:hypothetical protein
MKPRRWLPVLATLAVMAVTVLGGFAVAGALSEPAGPPVQVGGAVTVFPLSGWTDTGEGDLGDLAGARITRGTSTLDVFTRPTDLTAEAVLVRYVGGFLRPAAKSLQVSEDVREVSLADGLVGLRVSYVGSFGDRAAEVEGEVTVTVSATGNAVIFDAWGPSGQFAYSVGDTREMTRAAEIA